MMTQIRKKTKTRRKMERKVKPRMYWVSGGGVKKAQLQRRG